MRIRRVVQKRIQEQSDGVNIAGMINAAVSANINEPGSVTEVRTRTSNRIVQRGGATRIDTDQQTEKQATPTQEVDR
jgi:hypothetical protein